MLENELEDRRWLSDCVDLKYTLNLVHFSPAEQIDFIENAKPLFEKMKTPADILVIPEAPSKYMIEKIKHFSDLIEKMINRAEIIVDDADDKELNRRFAWLSETFENLDIAVGHQNWRSWLPVSNKKILPDNYNQLWDEETFSLREEKEKTPRIRWLLEQTKGHRSGLPPWYSIGIVFGDYKKELVEEYFSETPPQEWSGRMTAAAIVDCLCTASGSLAVSRNPDLKFNKVFDFLKQQDVQWDHTVKPLIRGLIGREEINEVILSHVLPLVSDKFLMENREIEKDINAGVEEQSITVRDNIKLFNQITKHRTEKLLLSDKFLKENTNKPLPFAL